MAVVIALPLFGTPGRELEDGGTISGPQLRKLSAELHERLGRAADTLDRLTAHGWTARVGMYDALLAHPAVETPDAAVRQLKALGIAPEELLIFEEPDDEEDTGLA